MGLIDSLKAMFTGAQENVSNLNVDELKDKANEFADGALDQAQNITDKIPGELDDKLVDKAQEFKDNLNNQK
jgi:hypothetical protein